MATRGRGRPRNPKITELMAAGMSRRTAFYQLKEQHQARLSQAARMGGNSRDRLNEHAEHFYITPPRGTYALLEVESLAGTIWEPACGDGAISRVLEAAGFTVISTDLVDRGYGEGGHDFLADHTTVADHIITNPPYGPGDQRGLAAKFVEHALARISPGGTVCMLLRTNWEAAQAHRHLMARCCRKHTFSRRLAMHRGGYNGKKGNPQMDCSWFVFCLDHTGPTLTKILPPECGDAPRLALAAE